jgi:hypothetical protein
MRATYVQHACRYTAQRIEHLLHTVVASKKLSQIFGHVGMFGKKHVTV